MLAELRIRDFAIIDELQLILAPGFCIYDPAQKPALGYDTFPDVVSSLQFERILSASGPCNGHVVRPSDGETPDSIAFIQCIGSRDSEHNYCSSVCCMYAVKEAVMAKEHEPDLECEIFYMDIRAPCTLQAVVVAGVLLQVIFYILFHIFDQFINLQRQTGVRNIHFFY